MLADLLGLNTAVSVFAFLVLAVIYFYGKNSVSHRIDYISDHQIWKDGTFVVGVFFFLPGTTAAILGYEIVNSLPKILYIFPLLTSFLVFTAGLFLSRRYFDKIGLDLRDKELNTWQILGFMGVSFSGTLAAIVSYHIHWGAALMPGFVLFIYGILLSSYLGKLDKDYRTVVVEHGEGETEGLLVRMNEDFLYVTTKKAVEIINRDSVHRIRDVQVDNTGGTQLRNWEGIHGGFNHVIRSRDLHEKVEKVRTSMANWMRNKNFEGFEDTEIDVAIVYEYTNEDDALDLDNLIKPIICALEKNHRADDGHWLVEDDSQIRQILAKSIKREDMLQEYTKVERNEDKDEWIETHGRITVSFREHSEKPMELVRPKK